MEFRNQEAIYLQIADFIIERILRRNWKEGDRVPSVRELAAELEVNPNTVMRTYTHLQDSGVLETQRGIGYFVKNDGYDKALGLERDKFLKEELPRIFKRLELLGFSGEEILRFCEEHLKQSEFGGERS
jgi:GntR family transcriptional regulator